MDASVNFWRNYIARDTLEYPVIISVMDDICKCGHPFSAHTKDERGELAMLMNKQQQRYDINSDKVVGEAGCTLCDCRHPQKS
jgi:hypothetical protein